MPDLQWAMDLVDRSSANAERIANSLAKMERHFDSAERKARETTGTLDSLGKVAKLVAGSIAAIKVMEFGHTVMDARRFKEETIIALRAIGQTKEQAAAVFGESQDFAFRTGNSLEQMATLARGLSVAGRSTSDIRVLQQVVSDIGVMKGQDKVPLMSEALLRLSESSKFTTRALMPLKEAGIDQEKIYEALAKRYHMTAAAAEKMVQKGGFGRTAGLQAITDVVSGMQTGGLGSATAMAADTVSHLVDSIKEEFVALFTAGDAEGFGGALVGPLRDVRDMLHPGSPFIVGVKAGLDEFAVGLGLVQHGGSAGAGLQAMLDDLKSGKSVGAEFAQNMMKIGQALAFVASAINTVVHGYDLLINGVDWKFFGEQILGAPIGQSGLATGALGHTSAADVPLNQRAYWDGAHWIDHATQQAVSPDAAALAVPKSMQHAEGGIVTRPTFGLIGESGPEAIIPLSKLGGGGGGGGGTNIILNISASGGSQEQAQAIGARARDVVLSALSAAFEEVALESGVS